MNCFDCFEFSCIYFNPIYLMYSFNFVHLSETEGQSTRSSNLPWGPLYCVLQQDEQTLTSYCSEELSVRRTWRVNTSQGHLLTCFNTHTTPIAAAAAALFFPFFFFSLLFFLLLTAAN